LLELGGVEPVEEGCDVEDQDLERVMGTEVEPPPVGVVEHQLDVGALGDDVVDPARILVVGEDPGVECGGLLIGDAIEVHAVEVAEGRELVAVETGGPRVVEIVPGPLPPGGERLAGAPGRRRVDLGEVAGSPEAVEGHAPALVGLHQPGQAVEGPEVVVRVDGRDGVDRRPDPLGRGRLHPRLPMDPSATAGDQADDRRNPRPLHVRNPLVSARLCRGLERLTNGWPPACAAEESPARAGSDKNRSRRSLCRRGLPPPIPICQRH
jgi:hypothetical protein